MFLDVNPVMWCVPVKTCTKCREIKTLDEFYTDKRSSDGRQSRCKECWNAIQREVRKDPERIEWNKNYQREWNARNPEKRKAISKRYYEKNAERLREYWREFRETKHELVLARGRAYRKSPGGKLTGRISSAKRRAAKCAGGSHTADDLKAIRAAQTDKQGRLICWACNKPISGTPHLDHWIPLAKGGTNDSGNLHYMHAKCNRSKHAKHPTEIGRLI